MDKVIIDGVDVSGCEFYQIEANELYPKAQYCGSMRNTFCENEPNCYYKQLKRLQAEYEDLHLSYAGCKTANTGLQELNQQLQSELQRYKDMEQKGLEEFKDVGGCWGCGLQLQLNQDIEDIKQLKAENERLKEENNELCKRMAEVTYRVTGGRLSYPNYTLDAIEQAFYDQLEILSDQKSEEYKQVLQEIKEICKNSHTSANEDYYRTADKIQAKINEVIGAK